jgi:2-amino-4-hydroxy-6-hydroxymethyldihydropteridine diphosphokinase
MIVDMRQKEDGIFLGLGGNLGDRFRCMQMAVEKLLAPRAMREVARSSLYETEPWGVADQPWYYNAVIRIATELSPEELLDAGQQVEEHINQGRKAHNSPRHMDIDVLFYHDTVCCSERLTIPHPRATERRFVLAPMAEIAPGFVHPVLRKDMRTLLTETGDTATVRRLPEAW